MRLLMLGAARADIVAHYRAVAARDVAAAETWIDAIEAASARLLRSDGAHAGWPFEARRATVRAKHLRLLVPTATPTTAILFRKVRDDMVIVRVLPFMRAG
jgi:hypothetical protein